MDRQKTRGRKGRLLVCSRRRPEQIYERVADAPRTSLLDIIDHRNGT
jgi:hypothetical protein